MNLKTIQRVSFSMPLSFLIWFLESVSIKIKVLVCVWWMIVSIIWYLAFQILIMYKENKELKRELKTTKERHQGLSNEYDKKRKQIEHYSFAWNNIGQLIGMALITNDSHEKIKHMYDAYLLNNQYIEGNDFVNAEHNQSNKNNQ